jgi:hypothetical protein
LPRSPAIDRRGTTSLVKSFRGQHRDHAGAARRSPPSPRTLSPLHRAGERLRVGSVRLPSPTKSS